LAKFVIDEDIARSTGTVLADAGHEIIDIRDHGLGAAEDEKIFRFAQSKKAVLLTGDFGFGNWIHCRSG
jgi:predicted nuclease of predicted toxin-antitoxin system